jgi:ABC-type dipeptide/oligopeptide/nickel transport system permease subunit
LRYLVLADVLPPMESNKPFCTDHLGTDLLSIWFGSATAT